MSDEDRDLEKERFSEALNDAIRMRGIQAKDLAHRAGMAPSHVSALRSGNFGDVYPRTVITLERALELAPGTLSRHLGYVPVEMRKIDAAIEAVRAIDSLPKDAREVLVTHLEKFWTLFAKRAEDFVDE